MSLVYHLCKQYVRGTPKKAIVQLVQVFLCHITATVMRGMGVTVSRVYISTRVLKHAYDKRPAEEFDFCVDALVHVVKYPDRVYRNKDGKRGSYCFVKKMKNSDCLVSLETKTDEKGDHSHLEVVTLFRPADDYLKSFDLLWEWKGGAPSS